MTPKDYAALAKQERAAFVALARKLKAWGSEDVGSRKHTAFECSLMFEAWRILAEKLEGATVSEEAAS